MAYRANTELMKTSKRQIAIYQNTSILLLGPRKGCNYETDFYKKLVDWLSRKRKEQIDFVHVFNWNSTLREKIEFADSYNLDAARKNLLELYNEYQTEKDDGLNIRFSLIDNTVPYVITDSSLVFVIPIENQKFSIELPTSIMKEEELNKILDEITRTTTILNLDKITEFYEGRTNI